jgi:hypothetical protein
VADNRAWNPWDLLVTFDRGKIPDRRADWIRQELASEILTAAMRVAAAHPDVPFEVDGEVLVPDQLASSVDVIGTRALRNGAADGRTTAEIAAALGHPREDVEKQLRLPDSRLTQDDDGRWWPRTEPR